MAWLVLVGLAGLTCQRAGDWVTDRRLWESARVHDPQSPRAWINLGAALALEDDFTGAEGAGYRAWRLALNRPEARVIAGLALVNLAAIRVRQGRIGEAKQYAADLRRRYPTWGPSQDLCAALGCDQP